MNVPVRDFVIDIETRHASTEFIQAAQSGIERGSVNPRFINPDVIAREEAKIEEAYQKALKQIKEKSACLNAAPIGCIGLAADKDLILWSCFQYEQNSRDEFEREEGVETRAFNAELEMMFDFTGFLDSNFDAYSRIVGFNSFKFDFSKIRLACRRNGVKIPEILTSQYKDNQIDLMRDFIRGFNCEDSRRIFISLKQVCMEFGIEYRKSMNGSEIPNAIERGEFIRVSRDCIYDVIETVQCLYKIRGSY